MTLIHGHCILVSFVNKENNLQILCNSFRSLSISLYSFIIFFRLSSLALQISTSDNVRYIHNLWRHISSTALRLLGLLWDIRCINEDDYQNSRWNCSLYIPGTPPAHAGDEEDVIEQEQAAVLPDPGAGARGHQVVSALACLYGLVAKVPAYLIRFLFGATRSLWAKPCIKTSSCRNCCCFTSCSLDSFSTVDMLSASSWISFSARLSRG